MKKKKKPKRKGSFLYREEAITAVVLEMEAVKLSEPLQFTIISTLARRPTSLLFKIEFPVSNASNIQHIQSLSGWIFRLISQIQELPH